MSKIRMGMVGGGEGAFIGAVHRMAAAIDGDIELVCGAFSSDAERSKRSGATLLLPEERDMVRREFSEPGDLLEAATGVKHREARIFLYYQAVCAAMADNVIVEGEMGALLDLAGAFAFDGDVARQFIQWVQDSIELRERGQQLLVEM